MVVMVAYWTMWFTHRSLVASERATFYVDFEDAFPLADAMLTVAMGATAWALWRGRSHAVLFGLLAGGGGLYLFGMDVLFDLEHGIWARGVGGLIELAINLLTLAATASLAGWIWTRREALERPALEVAGDEG
jgi:hypothetical protein